MTKCLFRLFETLKKSGDKQLQEKRDGQFNTAGNKEKVQNHS